MDNIKLENFTYICFGDEELDTTEIEVQSQSPVLNKDNIPDDIISKLRDQLIETGNSITELKKQVTEMEQKLAIEQFGIERFGTDDKLIKYYTGFNQYKTLKVFYEFIQPSASIMRDPYYQTEAGTLSLAGRKKM